MTLLVPLLTFFAFLSTVGCINPAVISTYMMQIQSVVVALDTIKADNATRACSNAEYVTTVDDRGLDGQLAKTLVCEEAAGVQVFPNTTEAEQVFATVFNALERIAAGDIFLCTFGDPGIEVLDNAGLNGPAILKLICTNPAELSSMLPTLTASFGSASSFSGSSILDTKTLPPSNFANVSIGHNSSSSSNKSGQASISSGSSSILLVSSQSSSSTFGGASSNAAASPSSPASTSAPDNVTVVVFTTFVTLTVTPTQVNASRSGGKASDPSATPSALPPLSFTMASRILPEQPVITSTLDFSSSSPFQWTWTVGPPLSFPNPELANGTAVSDSLGVETTCSDEV